MTKEAFREYFFVFQLAAKFRAVHVTSDQIDSVFASNFVGDLESYLDEEAPEGIPIVISSSRSLAPVLKLGFRRNEKGINDVYVISSFLLNRKLRKFKTGKDPLQAIEHICLNIPKFNYPTSIGGLRPIRFEDFAFGFVHHDPYFENFVLRFPRLDPHSAWLPLSFFNFEDVGCCSYILAYIGDPRWFGMSKTPIERRLLRHWGLTPERFEPLFSANPNDAPSICYALFYLWYCKNAINGGFRLHLQDWSNFSFKDEPGYRPGDVFLRKFARLVQRYKLSDNADLFDYLPEIAYKQAKYVLKVFSHIIIWSMSGYRPELLCPDAFLELQPEIDAFKEFIKTIRPQTLSSDLRIELLNDPDDLENFFPGLDISGN